MKTDSDDLNAKESNENKQFISNNRGQGCPLLLSTLLFTIIVTLTSGIDYSKTFADDSDRQIIMLKLSSWGRES